MNLGKSAYKCILALVKTDAFTGSKKEDAYYFPSEFDEVGIKNISLNLANADVDSFNDQNDDFKSHYLRLFNFTNMLNEPGAASITFEQFKKGLFLQIYDLSTNLSQSSVLLPVTKVIIW